MLCRRLNDWQPSNRAIAFLMPSNIDRNSGTDSCLNVIFTMRTIECKNGCFEFMTSVSVWACRRLIPQDGFLTLSSWACEGSVCVHLSFIAWLSLTVLSFACTKERTKEKCSEITRLTAVFHKPACWHQTITKTLISTSPGGSYQRRLLLWSKRLRVPPCVLLGVLRGPWIKFGENPARN